jgi:hypothetical protein
MVKSKPVTVEIDRSSSEITIRAFNKPPEDHPLYAAVGRVAAEWAELEHNLDHIIWRLSGTSPHLASCITSQMIGHFPRFNAIKALVTAHPQLDHSGLLKLIEKESGKVSELAESRARRVHDAWFVEQGTGEPHQFKSMPRKKHVFGFHPEAMSDMEKLIAQIAQRIEAIFKLHEKILVALAPSADK